jgi:hypothetical protein
MTPMAANLDPRIAEWPGGRIRVFARIKLPKKTGKKTPGGQDRSTFELVDHFVQEAEAKPFGAGFALLQPSAYEAAPGVWVYVEVRDGRLQAVSIESDENGPELTQSVLRSIGSLRKAVRHTVRNLAVRLAVDENGDVYGITATSPEEPLDPRSFEERTADVQVAVEQATGKPGRPRLPDHELELVAQVVREARSRREATDAAVAERFHITLGAAKKRIRIARTRGFLREEHNDG